MEWFVLGRLLEVGVVVKSRSWAWYCRESLRHWAGSNARDVKNEDCSQWLIENKGSIDKIPETILGFSGQFDRQNRAFLRNPRREALNLEC